MIGTLVIYSMFGILLLMMVSILIDLGISHLKEKDYVLGIAWIGFAVAIVGFTVGGILSQLGI